MTIEERVALGAAELDRLVPDWFETVKPRRLNLADSCNCVVGQLDGVAEGDLRYGDFGHGMERIFSNQDRTFAERLGFLHDDDRFEYPALTEAWRAEIRKRRKAAKAMKEISTG